MPASSTPTTSSTTNNVSTLDYALKEAERFQTFYNDVLAMHDLLENIQNITLRRQFREIINKIEDDFVGDTDFTAPRLSLYKTLRLGIIGGSLSGKSSLIQRFITGTNPKEDVMPGKHKKAVDVQGTSHLLLIRDETGPPDSQFSLWADAVLLVFSISDELSFNVISSYYAKMLQFRNERELPCFLVAVKDSMNFDSSNGSVSEARIKKFIGDHQKCPFFDVSLESGENVQEVFQTAAEKIVHYQNLIRLPSCDNLSISLNSLSLDASNSFSGSMNSLKKPKRRNTLFSLNKKQQQEEPVLDDIGSGRHIPVKQGYLYKKNHHSSIKDWKKKYVIIANDQTFSYYPSMKDYMDDNNAKSIKLIHASVKVPGKHGSKPSNQMHSLLQRSNSRSASAQNLHTTLNSTKSIEVTKPVDCYVISNTGTAENSPRENGNISGSPTIIQSCVERSLSDGKDYGPSSGIRVTQSFDAFPTKRKHRKANNRYKSCEIDYQVENDTSSDVDGILYTPSTPVIKKKALHRRQKSNANIKDLGIEGRATDTEDDDFVFSLVTIEGKNWDFECSSVEDRDSWVRVIESQILKAFQSQQSQPPKATEKLNHTSPTKSELSVQEILLNVSGNKRCADCDAEDPEWASINLGILICIECSGVHRNLGSHLSRVRSILLDDWPPEAVAVMMLLGNKVANSVWESRIHARKKPTRNSSREERERWICCKYEKKEFLSPILSSKYSISQEIMSCVKAKNLPECYSLLIRCKAEDVNMLSDVAGSKLAPLHMSCANANVPLTQLLLWYNADPKIVDDRGYNPIFYAHKSNSKECADLLFQYGCPEDTPC